MTENTPTPAELTAEARSLPKAYPLAVEAQALLERMADTIDAQAAILAEALAWAAEHGAPGAYPSEPFTFDKGVSAAATDVHGILSKLPADALAARDARVETYVLDRVRLRLERLGIHTYAIDSLETDLQAEREDAR